MKEALLSGAAMLATEQALKLTAADKYVASPRKNQGWTQEQIGAALSALMTGPKATRPRWKTIKRAMRQIANKVAVRRISYYGRDASCK